MGVLSEALALYPDLLSLPLDAPVAWVPILLPLPDARHVFGTINGGLFVGSAKPKSKKSICLRLFGLENSKLSVPRSSLSTERIFPDWKPMSRE